MRSLLRPVSRYRLATIVAMSVPRKIDVASRRDSSTKARSSTSPATRGSVAGWLGRWIAWPLLKWSLVVTLPFAALLRGSVYGYYESGSVVLALLVGFTVAFLVLFGYATAVYLRFRPLGSTYGVRAVRAKAAAVLILLSAFEGYLLLTPEPVHVKSTETAAEYSELHPLLRMGVGTFLLFDNGLLITDLSRHPDDYRAMGRSTNPLSLHYRQDDGYVHAFDLRTRDSSLVRNFLVESYFSVLGFRTLRHVGTADHLHVALPLPSG